LKAKEKNEKKENRDRSNITYNLSPSITYI
jgi:hypothetical protein